MTVWMEIPGMIHIFISKVREWIRFMIIREMTKLYGFSSGDRISVVNTVNFTYIQCNGEDIIKISKNRSMLKTNSFVLEIMDGTSVLQQEKLMDWNIWKSVRTYKIACPVSVQVYDDTTGEMVGEVKDGAEYNENTEYGNLYSIYNEETGEYDKMLDLTEGYSVKIVGENSGTMDVSITETAENGKESTYSVNEVPVSRDEVFTVEADQKELVSSDTSKEVIKLEDENGEKVCEHRDTFWKTTMNSACTKTGAKEKICNSCGAVLETQIIPMTAHTWGAESIIKQATVLEKGSRQKICKVCGATENTDIPKLSPSMTLTVSSLPLQVKKSVNAGSFVTGLANGDYVKSYVSGNKKIAVVSGKGKVTAKKAGTVKIVITLASGLKKNLTVKVQKSAVKTKKISGLKKNLALRVREKIKLSPIVSPVTSSQKISYSSSNKKIVTVSSKGVCTAKKVGKARITVKSGAKKYVVNVIVKK